MTPGIIPALHQLTEIPCTKDEKVLVNTPAHGCFAHAVEYARIIETGLPRMEKTIREKQV